ncbi:energy transducer TonB [Hugenholtzia roseola]|uniref:energy transducer TonB n=1 Tax=Hugenholtzia roseola TaxID=1002 RepID=UPI00041A6DA1|nr:energy transducer TonB [Hugenholtzia roseola]
MLFLSIGLAVVVIIGLIYLFRTIIDKSGKQLALEGSDKEEIGVVRKFADVDVLKYRSLLLNLGLIISLALALMAFEWTTYDGDDLADFIPPQEENETVTEQPVITVQPPPPPPEMRPQVVTASPEIQEVEDEVKIEDQIEIDIEDIQVDVSDVVSNVTTVAAPVQEKESDEIFEIVENPATFPGGTDKFYEYIGKNLEYPKVARRMDIQGKVFVSFVVDKDGSLSDVKIVKGLHESCDAEALRVVKSSPKWQPAKQRGKAVRYRMTIPIVFKLTKR